MATSDELQATFIVRFHRERGTPAGEWRGELEHVQTARRARFSDPLAIVAILRSQLNELEGGPDGDARTGVPGEAE